MKKINSVIALAMLAAAFFAVQAEAAQSWDQFVQQMEMQQKIKSEGPQYLATIAAQAPAGSDMELWKLSCSAPDLATRAAASVALVNRWFPNGDPAQWQQVTGFFPQTSYIPRQIVAVNAIFNAVTALSQMPEGKFAAAYLMTRFGQSSMGRLVFIDTTSAAFRKTLDNLIAETAMTGFWGSSTIEGPYPFVPVYNGSVTMNRAISNNYQFLDGFGGIATMGPYAWDRVHGYVYQIIEPGEHFYFKD
ncbi:MAG: hypothetical protein RRY12_05835 [Cloacibacillus sp.]